jgi:hypothetical protein
MIIGLDVHGVITDNPDFFRDFALWLREAGAKILIISGPPAEEVLEELAELGFFPEIHFDEVFSIVDYLKSSGCKMWQADGTWWADDKDWWSSKGQICEEQGVFMHIDDSEKYEPHFGTTQFVHWQRKD